MGRVCYDSVTATDIPTSAEMVAGYVSGPYAWSSADWARFPGRPHVTVATQANVNAGAVLDCETGDATPAQCPGWAQGRRAAGVDPTIYCNFSSWGAVQAAFSNAGMPQPWYWIAEWDGIQNVPTLNGITAVAKQYAGSSQSGGHYDLTYVPGVWPGIDTPQGAIDMNLTDTYKDWAGNTQSVESVYNNIDQRLFEVHQALLALQPSRFPGSNDGTGHPVQLNAVSAIMDTNSFALQAMNAAQALTGQVSKLPTTLPSLSDAQVTAIAGSVSAAVTKALTGQTAATPAQVAQAVLVALGNTLPKA